MRPLGDPAAALGPPSGATTGRPSGRPLARPDALACGSLCARLRLAQPRSVPVSAALARPSARPAANPLGRLRFHLIAHPVSASMGLSRCTGAVPAAVPGHHGRFKAYPARPMGRPMPGCRDSPIPLTGYASRGLLGHVCGGPRAGHAAEYRGPLGRLPLVNGGRRFPMPCFVALVIHDHGKIAAIFLQDRAFMQPSLTIRAQGLSITPCPRNTPAYGRPSGRPMDAPGTAARPPLTIRT